MCLGLRQDVLRAARKVGIEELTEVQVKALPKILSGRHTLVVAPTGSGKTESALLPVMSRILELSDSGNIEGIKAIYIAPLRALNRDMNLRFQRLGRELGIRVAVRHGDTPSSARRKVVDNPPDILITTPETLTYLLIYSGLRKALSRVRWVIIDEFHEMLSSKRGTHLLADLERLREIAGAYQRIALSASIGNIGLAAEALAPGKVVEVVQVPGVRRAEFRVYSPGRMGSSKVDIIADLIREFRPSLIFTNTRDEAEWLGLQLSKKGLKVRVHHGSLSRAEREDVEEGLRNGLLDGVVATSSLELGIDVGHIKAVIQSSSPKQAVKLLQRVGRSLHRVGESARGFIVTELSGDDVIESLVIARRSLAGDLEEPRPYKQSIDVLAHVLVGMGLEDLGFTPDKALKILRRSYPYLELSEDTLMQVLELLTQLRYVRFYNGRFRSTLKGKIYYYRHTMIVDTEQYRVTDVLTGRILGRLDSDFVATSVSEGSSVVLAGRVWRVVGIDEDESKIFVDGSSGEALIPSWVGENIPVDYKVAREVCGLRRLVALGHIPKNYVELASDDSINYLVSMVRSHVSKGYPLPHERMFLAEFIEGKNPLIIVHSCLGSRGNRALSYLITYPFIKYLGIEPRVKVDPYRVYVELPYNLTPKTVEDYLRLSLMRLDAKEVISSSVLKSGLGLMIMHKVLSRMGIIPKEAPSQVAKVIIKRYLDNELAVKEVLNEAFTRYLDLDPLIALLNDLREGKAGFKFLVSSSPSPLAVEGMKPFTGFDRVKSSGIPKDLIAELVKRRLLSKKVRLYCMVCGHSWTAEISELPDRPTCPKCGYSLVAPYFGKENLSHLVRKGLKAGRRYRYVLRGDERKVFEELLDSADLVLTYGKKAVIALAARGIGPKTARRILGVDTEVEFFNKIYEAEKSFLRTRRYWK